MIDANLNLIAKDAIFELTVCRIALQQIYSLIGVLKPGLEPTSNTRRLLEMAEAHIESISSNAESNEEELEARLSKCAPQNEQRPFRGAHGGEA
jgi:hypothetical protein